MKKYLLAIMAALTVGATANGEEGPKDSLKVVDIEEVMVIATPKENNRLRQQPLSSTSLSQTDMRNNAVSSIKGLSSLVPNLFIPEYGSKLTTSVYVRGIGSRINTPAVGLYVDNIPFIDKSAFDFNYSDIERIDVMRGPQGTLYGRNTMGGLIRICTKSPFTYQGTDLTLGAATYNNYKASVSHYHRISSRFAFSANFFYEHKGGFFKNTTRNNERVDYGDEFGGRMRAIYLKLQALERDSAELKNVLLVLDGTSLSRSQVQSGYSFLLPPEVSGQSLIGVQLKLLQTFALPNFLFAYLRYRMTGTISSSMKYMNPYGRIRNPQNNDALNPRERLIDEQQEAYWSDRPKEFPPRPAQEVVAAPVIGDEQAQLLRQIAALLHRHRTKVRLIISPDYDQRKLNPADKAALDHFFGRGVVFDFSGINAYTADYHNYYERGHYRPILGERLLQAVYEEDEGGKSR